MTRHHQAWGSSPLNSFPKVSGSLQEMHRGAGMRGLGKNGCHVPHPGRWRRLSERKTPLPPHVLVGSKGTAQAFCCSRLPVLKKHRAHLSVLPVLLLHPQSILDGGRISSYLSFQSLHSPHTALAHGFSSSSPSTPQDHVIISKPSPQQGH